MNNTHSKHRLFVAIYIGCFVVGPFGCVRQGFDPETQNQNNNDYDIDGWPDTVEIACGSDHLDSSSVPIDTDNDGSCDWLDLCEGDNSTGDTDNDKICNDKDTDDDDDDVSDSDEIDCGSDPLDSSSVPIDSDGDGSCDELDLCNGDNSTGDTDNDKICNDLDTDDDGDDWSDEDEIACGSNPLLFNSVPADTDDDGTPDCFDDCPFDIDKTTPGICGCGLPDEDIGTSVETTITQIAASSDDAEENVIANMTYPAGDVYLDSSDLELTNDTEFERPQQIVGLRFTDVGVPNPAIIQDAYVEFISDRDNSETTHLTISIQASDDAGTYETINFDISDRPRVSSKINWNSVTPWIKDNTYRTPDLSSAIQEVVCRTGWTSASSIAVIIEGTGSREAIAYDKSPAESASLYVTYQY